MLVAALSCKKSHYHTVDGWEFPMASLGITEKGRCMRIPFSWYMKLHQWVVGSEHFKAVSALIWKV